MWLIKHKIWSDHLWAKFASPFKWEHLFMVALILGQNLEHYNTYYRALLTLDNNLCQKMFYCRQIFIRNVVVGVVVVCVCACAYSVWSVYVCGVYMVCMYVYVVCIWCMCM